MGRDLSRVSGFISVGLDPGLQGGIAVVSDELVWTGAWETVDLKKSDGGTKVEYDETAVLEMLRKAAECPPGCTLHFYLEKQQAMPQQGVTSMFSTGMGYGMLRMALTALRVPWTLVPAQAWQKVLFAGMPKPPPRVAKKGKNAGKEVKTKASSVLGPVTCQRLWPGLDLRASERARTPHSGICDALLIAEYGRRTRGGQ